MNKLSKRILRELHTDCKNEPIICSYKNDFGKNSIFIDELAEKIGCSVSLTDSAAYSLCKKGLAEYVRLGEFRIGFQLTSDGNSFFEDRKKNAVIYILKNILVPIIVSAVTAEITMLLSLPL